jgi:hypothetical protein
MRRFYTPASRGSAIPPTVNGRKVRRARLLTYRTRAGLYTAGPCQFELSSGELVEANVPLLDLLYRESAPEKLPAQRGPLLDPEEWCRNECRVDRS